MYVCMYVHAYMCIECEAGKQKNRLQHSQRSNFKGILLEIMSCSQIRTEQNRKVKKNKPKFNKE